MSINKKLIFFSEVVTFKNPVIPTSIHDERPSRVRSSFLSSGPRVLLRALS